MYLTDTRWVIVPSIDCSSSLQRDGDMTDAFDEEPMSAEDAALVERLGSALGPDPQPDGMQHRLEVLFALRDMDRELMQLLQEAAAEPAGMRGTATATDRLAFELANGSVSVELVPERDLLRGQVLAGDITEVVLERTTRARSTAQVDRLGRFSFEAPTPGPARLRLLGPDFDADARQLTTDWFLL